MEILVVDLEGVKNCISTKIGGMFLQKVNQKNITVGTYSAVIYGDHG